MHTTGAPWYSAYQRTPDGEWVGTHRLPLSTAIFYCKQFRIHCFDCPVALVPDGADPVPWMELGASLA